MRITVVSGKGGVGKSILASSLAILFSKNNELVAIDCDVDAPNLALWLGIDTSNPQNAKFSKEISTTSKPFIDKTKCKRCGACISACNFQALELSKKKEVRLVSYKCEGCGLCEIVCPFNAIKLKPVKNCLLTRFDTKWGFPVIQGQIKPGEAESGEAVVEIRTYAKQIQEKHSIIIQDAAAGIGCPIIASIKGSDYIIAVAEPSLSSFSDLKRVLSVVTHFEIPYGIVLNKCDLNKQISVKIKKFADENYLGSISYDKKVVKSIVELRPVVESNIKACDEIQKIYNKLMERL
ncbi:ATP-binding protein [Candidatus Dojkabacteria bacterium]|nr:ATP-binding protein [Candidatus Dojkabacteria bacterium]